MLLRYAALAALVASATAFNIARQDEGDGSTEKEDTTVTVTETDLNVETVSGSTTLFKTVFSTIVVTKTELTTATVTEKDVDTATSTIYTTITQPAKRWVIVPPVAPALPPPTLTADVDDPTITAPDDHNLELLIRRGILMKRATVTATVTIAEDRVTTLLRTITSTVVSTTSSETTSLSTITTTAYENAKTTVTITSTIILKATTVTTGPAQTVDSVPDGSNIGDGGDGDNSDGSGDNSSDSSDSGSSSGLSTGAKAGIGAAAGVVGLALLAGIAYYFYKKHKNKPRVVDDGSGAGMSEVPVGAIGVGAAPSSRHSRTPDPKPPMSGGGAGYQEYYKPSGPAELGNTAKAPDAEMGGDELPRFPEASEADGRPVMGHTSGPVDPVYEMPAQNYR